MTHNLRVVRRPAPKSEMVKIRKMRIGERLFEKLFGKGQRVTILVPGDNVTSIEIREEEANHESHQTITRSE